MYTEEQWAAIEAEKQVISRKTSCIEENDTI